MAMRKECFMSKKLFNDNWQFTLKPIGTELSAMEAETDWHDVEIPHDWLIGDTGHLYDTGEGWYKKRFFIGNIGENDAYILGFDGVYMNSTVYVNGEEADTWKYGYSSFSFDITKLLKSGENTIYVRVMHEAPNTRWYSGAGIYRNVWLRKTSRVHILENGVYISSVKKDENSWLMTIETQTACGGCELRHTVLNKRGAVAAKISGKIDGTFSRMQLCAENPTIWDIDAPYCYTLKSELLIDGVVLDEVTNTFGFRTAEFNPEKGFIFNGRHMKMHGVCMHHDLGALGSAVNIHALRRQLEVLKSYGVNAIRTSHNMPARELVELCNEMGFLVDSEGFDMWEMPKNKNDYARFFPEWYETDVKSWIERDRNAPCVIMWSIGNEIADTHHSLRGLEVAKMLCEAVRKYDPHGNAKCTIGSNYMRWENAQKVADYLKLAGYNYTEDIYDEHHAAHPDWFIYGSETASTVRSRGIYHAPADVPQLVHEDMQCSDYGNSVVGWGKSHEKAWIDDRDRDYCGGQFIWTGFDYIGEPTPYSTKNSYFGIVDTAGFPKDSYYLYKAVWTDGEKSPFVHILPHWDFNSGEEIDVFTYSNVEDVELFFNEESLGKQHVDLQHGNVLHGAWKVPFNAGSLTAKVFYPDGTFAAEETIHSFGEPVAVEAKADKTTFAADGRDLIFIEITVKDANDVTVENARNRVKVTIGGPARLVGLDNGDSTDYDSYKGDNRRLFSGKLLAIVQSTLYSGAVTVTIESEGLTEKLLVLEATECEAPEGISVVNNYYPFTASEYRPEIPIRKIELAADRNVLDTENPTARITAVIKPENADYSDISWKCVLDTGVEIGLSDIQPTKYGALVTAKGDGKYRLRAVGKNGGDIPQIISELEFENVGFGNALVNPYNFVSASLYSFSNEPLNVIERGAISGIHHRTVIGFDNLDFGSFGSNRIVLHCGYCDDNSPTASIEVWDGNPDDGGKHITTLDFKHNNVWDGFKPQEFELPERISGIRSLAFVVSQSVIVGGFEFRPLKKAFEQLAPTEHDALYGDEYHIDGKEISGIGNNVLIYFNGMDFGDGTDKIVVCGRTPNDVNTIQLRYNDDNGVQQTQLLPFPKSEDYTEVTFPLEKISGMRDISFVFLPGSRFDFKWFRFE